MRLSSTQLETLRTRPHQTRLDLFVFKPRAIMKCKIADPTIAKGARTIYFDTVSLGDFSEVENGMTLLVGSAEGLQDIGKIRIAGVTSSYFLVSENSNIKWQDELHLTVLRYWDLWPVFPRIIQDPNNSENVIFYKDYDIEYTNQNFELGTFVNAGSHRPVLIENGTGTVYYTSSGTHNLLGNNLLYDWAFEGGTPTGSSTANPGNVHYTEPGDYVTRLIVTDQSTSVTDIAYRYVSVRDKIGSGGNTPIAKWEMSPLSGSRDEAGYNVEFKIYDPTIQIDEDCVIMLKATDWHGNTKTSLGGNVEGASDVFFVGYIERGTIHYNAFYSYVSFAATSITNILKKLTSFSVSVESKDNPTSWYELRDMDIRRAIYHYLRWQSTVLPVTDFTFVGTDRKIQFFDADRTSIFDAIDNLMKSALVGRVSSDRQGRLYAEVDPQAYPDPTGTFIPVMDITKRDWMSTPIIDEQVFDTMSYLELGGIAYTGAVTGTFEALLSGAPGYAPSFHGSVERIQGLALENQDQLNTLSGHIWANRNQRFPIASMDMAVPVRNLDIAPQETVSLRVARGDTVRDKEINGLYIPTDFSWTYNPTEQILLPSIQLTGLVNGEPGDTVLIPVEVGDIGFEFPEFTFPPLPSFYIPNLAIIDPLNTDNVLIHVRNHGLFYTPNFSSESPQWVKINTNLEGDKANFRNFEVAAGGRMYVQFSGLSAWTASHPGGVWSKVFDFTQIDNPENYPFPRNQLIQGIGVNREDTSALTIAGLIVTIFSSNIIYPWVGGAGGFTRAMSVFPFIANPFSRFTYVTYGNGQWTVSYQNESTYICVARFSQDGGTLISQLEPIFGAALGSVIHTRSKYSQEVISMKLAAALPGDNVAAISYDNGNSFIGIAGTAALHTEAGAGFSNQERSESIITNADGTQILYSSSSYSQGLVISYDSGNSWTASSFQSSGSTAVWHLGDNSYVYAGNNQIYLIEDSLTSTESIIKTGNLTNIITGSFEVIAIRHY